MLWPSNHADQTRSSPQCRLRRQQYRTAHAVIATCNQHMTKLVLMRSWGSLRNQPLIILPRNNREPLNFLERSTRSIKFTQFNAAPEVHARTCEEAQLGTNKSSR